MQAAGSGMVLVQQYWSNENKEGGEGGCIEELRSGVRDVLSDRCVMRRGVIAQHLMPLTTIEICNEGLKTHQMSGRRHKLRTSQRVRE